MIACNASVYETSFFNISKRGHLFLDWRFGLGVWKEGSGQLTEIDPGAGCVGYGWKKRLDVVRKGFMVNDGQDGSWGKPRNWL